jgi:hypothetical protein
MTLPAVGEEAAVHIGAIVVAGRQDERVHACVARDGLFALLRAGPLQDADSPDVGTRAVCRGISYVRNGAALEHEFLHKRAV